MGTVDMSHRAVASSQPPLEPSSHPNEGRGSSMSVRSLGAFHSGDEGGGAAIPDIPTRRSSRRQDVVDFLTSPEAFRNVRRSPGLLTEPESPHRPMSPHRPVNPNTLGGTRSRATSALSNRDQAAFAHFSSPEPEDDFLDTVSRTASSTPKSILSSQSKAESSASSFLGTTSLAPLQARAGGEDGLEPLAEEEIDPASFDLVVPAHAVGKQYSLETQSELLFSVKHLAVVFEDPVLLQRFTSFLCSWRPESVPVLVYYLDTLKALRAINYANAVAEALSPIKGLDFTQDPAARTVNMSLRAKADKAFETLVNDDLPAYITHTYIQTVSLTIKRRIADTLPAPLREMSEGLAEVFCLTDPSRPDNPIVFASEEFHRTTQYGMSYVLGRNCRFLQGPKTNQHSVRRLREKLKAGVEHCETFLNYRRDGTPFMNLLMVAPLYDSRGVVRYCIGAQVDVSGLVKECAGLESLHRLMERENPELAPKGPPGEPNHHEELRARTARQKVESDENAVQPVALTPEGEKDEFRELAAMFNMAELRTVRESGGSMHRVKQEDMSKHEHVSNWHKPRLLIRDDATLSRKESDPILRTAGSSRQGLRDAAAGAAPSPQPSLDSGGRLSGVYEHYLLVRPYPSLKVLFASPSLRVPGMLQSNFLARVGGSARVRDAIEQAFADGSGVTAKVRWATRADPEGRPRWIHATPLLGSNGAVGVWMVVLVDDEADPLGALRPSRDAPPVERFIRRPAGSSSSAAATPAGFGPDSDGMSLGSFADAQRAVDDHHLHTDPLLKPGAGAAIATARPSRAGARTPSSAMGHHRNGAVHADGSPFHRPLHQQQHHPHPLQSANPSMTRLESEIYRMVDH